MSTSEDLTDFDAKLTELRALADSTRMQGNYFEELVRHFLMRDSTYAGDFEHVWLWKEWPERDTFFPSTKGKDIGVDLVAQRRDGGVTAVQCKFLRHDYRVQKGDLDGFLATLGKQVFTHGLWVDTTGVEWSANAEEARRNQTKPVQRIGLEHFRHSNIDWSGYTVTAPDIAPPLKAQKQLRPHQYAAIRAIMDAFANPEHPIDRGKLIMACGTGKTFTALKLAEAVTKEPEETGRTSNILFLVPSLALLQQTLMEWSQEHDPEIEFQAFVCASDSTIGRKATGDITTVAIDDLAAPATTDGRALARAYDDYATNYERETDLPHRMTVIFSTYHSIQAVHEAQQMSVDPFDLIICDEAHRTTGVTLADEDESAFVRIHDADYIKGSRRVYMTATPRIFNDKVKDVAKQKDAELASMDDEGLFGPELYRLSFARAVEENLLSDYKVLVLGIAEEQVSKSFQRQLGDETFELPVTDVAKLVGCWNGLAKREQGMVSADFGTDTLPMRRAVAFARDIRTSKRIASEFDELVNEYLVDLDNDDPTDDLRVKVRHIDGSMRATQRGA